MLPDEEDPTEMPAFRATIQPSGDIRIIDWGPWLATGGPMFTMLDARARAGVAIADLTVIRNDEEVAVEVIVEFLTGDRLAARAALTAWAELAGYTRAWFDGEVVELDPVPGGRAQVRCTGCLARFVDGGPSLWEYVRCHGAFPKACTLCGSDLPQWTAVGAKRRRPTATTRRSAGTSRRTVQVSDRGHDERPI